MFMSKITIELPSNTLLPPTTNCSYFEMDLGKQTKPNNVDMNLCDKKECTESVRTNTLFKIIRPEIDINHR